MSDGEQPMTGGNTTDNVVRVGSTVHRSVSAHSGLVRSALRFLRERNVGWAPVHLGSDDVGRDVFSFIEGTTSEHPAERDERSYAAFAAMLRELHDITRGTVIASGGECLVHGDAGPFNVVMQRGMPVGLIDWDNVHPGDPMEDVGYAGWTWCIFNAQDIPVEDQARRLRSFSDGYEPDLDPATLIDAVLSAQAGTIAAARALAATKPLSAGRRANAVATISWAEGCRDVVLRHEELFSKALQADG